LKNAIKLQRAIKRLLKRLFIWKNLSKIAREQITLKGRLLIRIIENYFSIYQIENILLNVK